MKSRAFIISQLAFGATSLFAVTVDGQRDTGEYSGTPLLVSNQSQATPWGNSNALANLHAVQDGADLSVFLGGRSWGNAIILFVDCKSGGANVIPNTFTGGDGYQLNNMNGMTLPTGFTADYAIRFYGDAGNSYMNVANFSANTVTYFGNAGTTNVVNSFITDARVQQFDITDNNSDTAINELDYPAVTKGIEMKLNLAGLGVPVGVSNVKLFALLVNGGSDFAPNQTLAANASAATMGNLNDENFASQGLSIEVTNTDTDGDGTPNDTDEDDDGDNILDIHETNTGIYLSQTDTGSNPLLLDTDGDGESDENEVYGNFRSAPLNFISDPNVKTYAIMAIPGSYTTPVWKEDGSASNSMVRKGTSIEDQNQWTLDYNFTRTWRDLVQANAGDGIAEDSIKFKIAAGSWSNNWGGTSPALVPNGADMFYTVVATGIHRFSFNNRTLAYSLTRSTFTTAAEYYTAYGITDPNADPDNDGLTNAAEAALNSDPNNSDTDGDSTLDNLDSNVLSPEVYAAWALSYAPLSSDLRTADPDGDGRNNLHEFLFGGNPKQGADTTVTVAVASNNVTLTWIGRSASSQASYVIQNNTDLNATWNNTTATVTNATDQSAVPSGYTRYQAVVPVDGSKHFYRVVGTEL